MIESEPTASTSDDATVVNAIIHAVRGDRARLMDILQETQRRLGHLSDKAIHLVAAGLGIHAVEVEDMASFYAFLNREPKGRFHIRLSKTPVSLMQGAKAVAEALSTATGAAIGGTSTDGEFTLEWTNDIGMSDQEPAALINGTVVTRLTSSDAGAIVAALRQHRAENTMPLFAGPDVQSAGLPKAQVDLGLVKSGPVCSDASCGSCG